MPHTPPREWMPDLCRLPRLFLVLVASEVAVLVIALAPAPEKDWSGERLLAASLFAQWLALVSAVVLCKLRPVVHRLPLGVGVLLAWCVPIAAGFLGSLMVHELDSALGLGLSLPAPYRWRSRFLEIHRRGTASPSPSRRRATVRRLPVPAPDRSGP